MFWAQERHINLAMSGSSKIVDAISNLDKRVGYIGVKPTDLFTKQDSKFLRTPTGEENDIAPENLLGESDIEFLQKKALEKLFKEKTN